MCRVIILKTIWDENTRCNISIYYFALSFCVVRICVNVMIYIHARSVNTYMIQLSATKRIEPDNAEFVEYFFCKVFNIFSISDNISSFITE